MTGFPNTRSVWQTNKQTSIYQKIAMTGAGQAKTTTLKQHSFHLNMQLRRLN